MTENDIHGERYESTRRAWEEIWNSASIDVELEAIEYPRAQETVQAYLPYLPKDDVILEAGSGLSAVVIWLRRRGYNVVGLDYAVNALRVSRQYDPSLPLVAGDIHKLPHADNSIGAYLSFGVLEHFEHGMLPGLQEAYRVLKPGGVLVLTIPYPNIIHKLLVLRRKISGQSVLNDDEFYESTYDRSALADNVQQAGFNIELMMPTGHSYTLWGLGGPFRAEGYYRTTQFAEKCGAALKRLLPWPFNFMTLVVARK